MRLQLHWQVLIAMVAGVVFALVFGSVPLVDAVAEIFLRLLRMVIVPLIFISIVHGVAGIGASAHLGRLGVKTLLYYGCSSLLAALLGGALASLLRPGRSLSDFGAQEVRPPEGVTETSVVDTLIGIVPTNPVAAAAEFDILGLIFFSILLGAAGSRLQGESGELVRRVFAALFELVMKLTHFVIHLLPIGAFALIARAVGAMGWSAATQIGQWMLLLTLGLAIHLFLVLPALLLLFARRSPLKFARGMASAIGMAFSTTSSAATLPVTMTCVRENLGVSQRVTSFVLPMGATVNMDATALHQCAGTLFIAQAVGFDLSAGAMVSAVLASLLVSVGAAAVPSAGVVMIFIVLEAIGLDDPRAYGIVGLMLSVDRPLDMMRTAVNVVSDAVGATIVAHSEGEDLKI